MLSLQLSPFPELATARLLLQPLSLADTQALFDLRNNKQVILYLDQSPFADLEEAGQYIVKALQQRDKGEGLPLKIVFKDAPDHLIGTIGFWRITPAHYRAEIGYMLHPDHWRKGIMKEAVERLTRLGFKELGIHSIEANINPANIASAALLKSCGFKEEGLFKESYFFNGVFYDAAIFSLLDH